MLRRLIDELLDIVILVSWICVVIWMIAGTVALTCAVLGIKIGVQ